ncbi:50S ribosomal protein L17 [Patescibacteria group bacterium]|nr:50S ribosomal protein L17 [Patescibacteria group bacterium]
MKHKVAGRKLGRNHHQRQSLFRIQARAMFTYGKIKTTEAKAKAVLPLVEKLCRLAQKADLSSRRRLFAVFQNKRFVNSLVKAVAISFKDVQMNFTKIIKLKRRQGDDALIVLLSFVKPYQLNPPAVSEKTIVKKKTK